MLLTFSLCKTTLEIASDTPFENLSEVIARRRAKHFLVSSQIFWTLGDGSARHHLLLNCTKSLLFQFEFDCELLEHLNND